MDLAPSPAGPPQHLCAAGAAWWWCGHSEVPPACRREGRKGFSRGPGHKKQGFLDLDAMLTFSNKAFVGAVVGKGGKTLIIPF